MLDNCAFLTQSLILLLEFLFYLLTQKAVNNKHLVSIVRFNTQQCPIRMDRATDSVVKYFEILAPSPSLSFIIPSPKNYAKS